LQVYQLFALSNSSIFFKISTSSKNTLIAPQPDIKPTNHKKIDSYLKISGTLPAKSPLKNSSFVFVPSNKLFKTSNLNSLFVVKLYHKKIKY